MNKRVHDPSQIICLDIEASGLGTRSYPIEIAWKQLDSEDEDDFLIDPRTGYNWTNWDESAAEIHGLSLEELYEEGISVKEACSRLNQRLRGKYVYSDAFEFDYFWITRLFDAGMVKPQFRLLGLEELLNEDDLELYQKVSHQSPRRHRAMPDVDDLIRSIKPFVFQTQKKALI
jgi:hypothetical protein